MIKLIEAVREARKLGLEWIAVDKDGDLYGYQYKPEPYFTLEHTFVSSYKNGNDNILIDDFDLKCDWTKSLIELSKIKVK